MSYFTINLGYEIQHDLVSNLIIDGAELMIDFDLSFAFMFHIRLNLTSFSFGVGFFSSGQLFGLMSLLDAFIFQLCVYFSCVSHQQIRAGLLQCYC